MFTTIMYSFINEVTRQSGNTEILLTVKRGGAQRHSAAQSRRRIRRAAAATPRHRHIATTYLVLADSFKRAAGFH